MLQATLEYTRLVQAQYVLLSAPGVYWGTSTARGCENYKE